ncbi:MAG: hypothetical protein E7586_05080 [Ruminococcaceae bacterium]|nr:hypothetical protein [Oscillospiraceae bacterium]
MTARTKKEILTAILLICCLLLSATVMMFVENKVGIPSLEDGKIQNINVRINEICASNGSVIATDSGDFPDYIELYNAGDSFNLSSFGLAKDTSNEIVYTFGNIEFKAKSYLIVYLDGVNVPFKLNSNGNEYIALVSKEGNVVDSLTTKATRSNEVMLLDGGEYTLSYDASPGFPNTAEGVEAFRAGDKESKLALSISEILTYNQSVLPDYQGDYCDIIELKNTSSAVISTKGYFISDSLTERNKCPLPEIMLAPGELMLVFASGKNLLTESGEFHTDFKLNEEENVVVSIGSKYFSQKIEKCSPNCSMSLTSNESGEGVFTEMTATPGFPNDDTGAEALEESRIYKDSPLVINEILLSIDETPFDGSVRDVIEIMNISEESVSTKGWFISDSQKDPYSFALPESIIEPNQCLLLYAERSDRENATGFGLSSRDAVYLTAPNFKRSEFISCAEAGSGKSLNRIIDNGESVYVSGEISLGFPNDSEGQKQYASSIRPDELEISEIVSSNKSYLPGPYKTYHDFIELHNRTDKEIDLSEWYLSDDVEEPRKGSLKGVIIPANSYLVIILSSEGVNIPDGYPKLDFALSSSGETVVLSKGDFIVDHAVVPSMGADTSFGRADGQDGFEILESPTPENPNNGKAKAKAVSPTSSLPQGVYKEKEITVELKGEGNIYYTLDATIPSAASSLYTQPLKINSTTVIRCVSVAQGKQISDVADLTFVVNEPDTLETISIISSPDNFFDYYSGIYSTGPNAAPNFPYDGANYYQRWEREATLSFFDKDGGGFSEKCGVRIFGGLSRALEKKSMAFFFRSAYGNGELNYKLFENDSLEVYESLVLRNTGQDWRLSAMRDAMITSLASDYMGLDVQNCRPVAVYLNGKYWGIYFIREKLNEHYVAGHYNVSAEEAEVSFANGKSSTNYKAMVSYASTHDMSVKENYDYICTLMDVENYADYIVAEIIIGNGDNGNIRFFTYEGGKWRWMMYDVDHAFRSASSNSVEGHLNPAGTGASDMFSTALINSLLKNPDFKKMFLEEFAYQLENIWTSEIVNEYIDRFSGMIANDIARDCQRWDHSYDAWKSSVESLRSFIDQREDYIERYVKSYFSLSDDEMRNYGFTV